MTQLSQKTVVCTNTNVFMPALAAAAAPAARASQIVIYDQAPHAFHADYRPSYRKDAAEDGWKRMLAWFRQHGL